MNGSDALATVKLAALAVVAVGVGYVAYKGVGFGKSIVSDASAAIGRGVDAVSRSVEGAKNAALDTVSGSEGRDFYQRQYADVRIAEAAQIFDANDARARRTKPVIVQNRAEVSYWDGLLDGSSGGYVAP
jgi:hypothetical protein